MPGGPRGPSPGGPATRHPRNGAETTREERKPAWREVLERCGLQGVEEYDYVLREFS
ncbi:hypothetical protein [Streptomyces olivaceoviridis]|uniref:hypothetical protein n=1 Tax=Streptomyces olivaceoviridis TaxID=1921 RepID=UPI00331DCE4C